MTDKGKAAENKKEDCEQAPVASSGQDRLQSQKSDDEKAVPINASSVDQAGKDVSDNPNTDGADVSQERPMSPGTLALMCDEKDPMFMAAPSANGLTGHGYNRSLQLPCGEGMTEIYAELEKFVLITFHNCLNRIITCGEIKGKCFLHSCNEFGSSSV